MAYADYLELMQRILKLTLADSEVILAAAESMAIGRHAPVTIALVGSDGHLLRLKRLDGACAASCEVAIAKARMAALNAKPTASLETAINTNRPALLQLSGVLGQPATAMGGGIPLVVDGQCLGAIGISGMTPDQDIAIAEAGVQAFLTLLP